PSPPRGEKNAGKGPVLGGADDADDGTDDADAPDNVDLGVNSENAGENVGPDAEGADDADDADDFWDHAAHGCDGGDDGEGELLTQSGKAGDDPVCRRCGIPAGAFGEIVPCGPNGSA